MKRIIAIVLVILICCGGVFLPTYAKSSSGIKEEYLNEDKWLTLSKNTNGPRYFVDADNKPVNLFGMARCQHHAYEEDVIYANGGRNVDSLVEHYADYGCNFMRLSVDMPELCGGNKRTKEQIIDFITNKIDPDVQAIIRNGLYVMIDIHMYPPSSCKTVEGIVNYARNYYLPVIVELARLYKDEPMVAAIEPWNEPYPADQQQLQHDKEKWNKAVREYYLEAVKEIRKVNTRHVILVSDWNAGWGCALPETWDGYYKKIDPVYNNVAYSVHASHQQLDIDYNFYSDWWKSTASDNNICLLFGEIETEPGISTTQGMKNMCKFFSETKDEYHFSGVLWRPHGVELEYSSIWAENGWARNYCSPSPSPTSRYVVETENLLKQKPANAETINDNAFFGTKTFGTGVSLKAGLSNDKFHESTTEITKQIVYKQGKYKLMVRAAGKDGYTGDFIIGYKDVSGTVHQIAKFEGKDTNMKPYYQTAEFIAEKQIASFVFFGCDKKVKSVAIDRLYIEGKAAKDELTARSKFKIPNTKKIIYLNGEEAIVDIEEPKVDNSFNNADGGSSGDVDFGYGSFGDNSYTDNSSGNTVSNGSTQATGSKDKNNNSKKDDSSTNNGNLNENYQNFSGDGSELSIDDFKFNDTASKRNNGIFTPVVIGVLIVAMCIWVGLLVAVIIVKVKKSKKKDTEI